MESKHQSSTCQALAYVIAHLPSTKSKVKYEHMKKDEIFAKNDSSTTIVNKLLKIEHIRKIQLISIFQSLSSMTS